MKTFSVCFLLSIQLVLVPREIAGAPQDIRRYGKFRPTLGGNNHYVNIEINKDNDLYGIRTKGLRYGGFHSNLDIINHPNTEYNTKYKTPISFDKFNILDYNAAERRRKAEKYLIDKYIKNVDDSVTTTQKTSWIHNVFLNKHSGNVNVVQPTVPTDIDIDQAFDHFGTNDFETVVNNQHNSNFNDIRPIYENVDEGNGEVLTFGERPSNSNVKMTTLADNVALNTEDNSAGPHVYDDDSKDLNLLFNDTLSTSEITAHLFNNHNTEWSFTTVLEKVNLASTPEVSDSSTDSIVDYLVANIKNIVKSHAPDDTDKNLGTQSTNSPLNYLPHTESILDIYGEASNAEQSYQPIESYIEHFADSIYNPNVDGTNDLNYKTAPIIISTLFNKNDQSINANDTVMEKDKEDEYNNVEESIKKITESTDKTPKYLDVVEQDVTTFRSIEIFQTYSDILLSTEKSAHNTVAMESIQNYAINESDDVESLINVNGIKYETTTKNEKNVGITSNNEFTLTTLDDKPLELPKNMNNDSNNTINLKKLVNEVTKNYDITTEDVKRLEIISNTEELNLDATLDISESKDQTTNRFEVEDTFKNLPINDNDQYDITSEQIEDLENTTNAEGDVILSHDLHALKVHESRNSESNKTENIKTQSIVEDELSVTITEKVNSYEDSANIEEFNNATRSSYLLNTVNIPENKNSNVNDFENVLSLKIQSGNSDVQVEDITEHIKIMTDINGIVYSLDAHENNDKIVHFQKIAIDNEFSNTTTDFSKTSNEELNTPTPTADYSSILDVHEDKSNVANTENGEFFKQLTIREDKPFETTTEQSTMLGRSTNNDGLISNLKIRKNNDDATYSPENVHIGITVKPEHFEIATNIEEFSTSVNNNKSYPTFESTTNLSGNDDELYRITTEKFKVLEYITYNEKFSKDLLNNLESRESKNDDIKNTKNSSLHEKLTYENELLITKKQMSSDFTVNIKETSTPLNSILFGKIKYDNVYTPSEIEDGPKMEQATKLENTKFSNDLITTTSSTESISENRENEYDTTYFENSKNFTTLFVKEEMRFVTTERARRLKTEHSAELNTTFLNGIGMLESKNNDSLNKLENERFQTTTGQISHIEVTTISDKTTLDDMSRQMEHHKIDNYDFTKSDNIHTVSENEEELYDVATTEGNKSVETTSEENTITTVSSTVSGIIKISENREESISTIDDKRAKNTSLNEEKQFMPTTEVTKNLETTTSSLEFITPLTNNLESRESKNDSIIDLEHIVTLNNSNQQLETITEQAKSLETTTSNDSFDDPKTSLDALSRPLDFNDNKEERSDTTIPYYTDELKNEYADYEINQINDLKQLEINSTLATIIEDGQINTEKYININENEATITEHSKNFEDFGQNSKTTHMSNAIELTGKSDKNLETKHFDNEIIDTEQSTMAVSIPENLQLKSSTESLRRINTSLITKEESLEETRVAISSPDTQAPNSTELSTTSNYFKNIGSTTETTISGYRMPKRIANVEDRKEFSNKLIVEPKPHRRSDIIPEEDY